MKETIAPTNKEKTIEKGTKLLKGSVITLVYGSGAAGVPVKLPNLKGMTVMEAKNQLGIVGLDVIEEFSYEEIYSPVNLGIGSCRLSVAEPFKMALKDDPKAWTHLKIATKYPKITKKHFARRGVQAECLKLNGALEVAPKLDLSSRIVDLVSTGKTLKENGLIEVEKIMDITSYLIVNKNMAKTYPNRIRKIISNFRKVVNA